MARKPMPTLKQSGTRRWANRIVGHGERSAREFLAHPMNWHIHPQFQQDSLRGALDELGWLEEVTVNRKTGLIVNGHLRVTLALEEGPDTLVPYKEVELTEAEELKALSTIDPLGALNQINAAMLDEVLQQVQPTTEALDQFIVDLRDRYLSNPMILPADETGAHFADNPTATRVAGTTGETRVLQPLRMVQLVFPEDRYHWFTEAIKRLMARYNTKSLAETIVAALEDLTDDRAPVAGAHSSAGTGGQEGEDSDGAGL